MTKEPFGPSRVMQPYQDSKIEWLGGEPGKMIKLYHVIGHEETPSQFFEVGVYEILPGEKVPVHVHDEGEEFAYVLNGSAILLGENETVLGEMPQGKLVYAETGAPHGYMNHTGLPVELLVWTSKKAGLDF